MKPTVPFSDFSRLDLCIGTVVSAKKLEGTENLLVLDVELDESIKRRLVAGLAKTHKTKELVGRQVVVVSNLEGRKIKGVESQGMILAADVEGAPVLLTPEKKIPSGTKVR